MIKKTSLLYSNLQTSNDLTHQPLIVKTKLTQNLGVENKWASYEEISCNLK